MFPRKMNTKERDYEVQINVDMRDCVDDEKRSVGKTPFSTTGRFKIM
jgi:hypothetical protein